MNISEIEIRRFWGKVDKTEECWEWTASRTIYGYGCFRYGGELFGAHRVSYFLAYGNIPEGMCICHHCDNPSCVKPSHLFLGTKRDNARDSVSKGRWTHSQGVKNGNSKLVENDVYEIRRLYSLGVKCSLLAKMWGIGSAQADRIAHMRQWKHLRNELTPMPERMLG